MCCIMHFKCLRKLSISNLTNKQLFHVRLVNKHDSSSVSSIQKASMCTVLKREQNDSPNKYIGFVKKFHRVSCSVLQCEKKFILNLKSSCQSHQINTAACMSASDSQTEDVMLKNMLIFEDFISVEEEKSILEEIEPYLRRMRYEFNHWDDAIHGFRETEKSQWQEINKALIQRVRDVAFPPGTAQLSSVHVLDIDKKGYIKAHVDAVRFCGNTIAGISLLSSAVMRLVHTEDKSQSADFLLKPRSLYIMKDDARYNYTHEVLEESVSMFRGEVVPRERRISIMCRNEPNPDIM